MPGAITETGPNAMIALNFDASDLIVWVIPGLALTVPGLLIVLVVAAQAFGATLFLPVARRRIGDFGVRRTARRRPLG